MRLGHRLRCFFRWHGIDLHRATTPAKGFYFFFSYYFIEDKRPWRARVRAPGRRNSAHTNSTLHPMTPRAPFGARTHHGGCRAVVWPDVRYGPAAPGNDGGHTPEIRWREPLVGAKIEKFPCLDRRNLAAPIFFLPPNRRADAGLSAAPPSARQPFPAPVVPANREQRPPILSKSFLAPGLGSGWDMAASRPDWAVRPKAQHPDAPKVPRRRWRQPPSTS